MLMARKQVVSLKSSVGLLLNELQVEMQHMLSQSEAFFKLPKEQKANYSFDLVQHAHLLCNVLPSSQTLHVCTYV